jgi:hypothetical protein
MGVSVVNICYNLELPRLLDPISYAWTHIQTVLSLICSSVDRFNG